MFPPLIRFFEKDFKNTDAQLKSRFQQGLLIEILKLSDLSQQTSSDQRKVNWVALSLFALRSKL